MGIIIQKIRTTWTKASRGEPLASLRNRTPEKLDFPFVQNDENVHLQEITFSENSDFHYPFIKPIKTINTNQLREVGLELSFSERIVAVVSRIESSKGKKVGALGYNNWAQIITNRRTVGEYTWVYYKQVINLFYGDNSKAPDITSSTEAQVYFDDRKLLI